MTKSLYTVAWPTRRPPEIYEIQFSYEFCRRKSQDACEEAGIEFAWVDYGDDTGLDQILSRVKGRFLLMASTPELVMSCPAIKGLISSPADRFDACGPVFNQTPFSAQLAGIPFPYLDMDSFEEAAQALAQGLAHGYVEVDQLDPACILYNADFLRGLSPAIPVSRLSQRITGCPGVRLGAATGALVHHGFMESLASPRDDLVRLVPEGVKRVLDIGCARGGYGKALKASHPDIFIIGIEQNPILAAAAAPHYDDMITAPVEHLCLDTPVDLVNCGDVLEHLQDPWAILTQLHRLLKPGGYLVMSIPNAGHWTIVRQLIRGRFEYIPLGPLCISHLRWFTGSSIQRDLQKAGFFMDRFERQQIAPTPGGTAFIEALCRAMDADEASLRTNEFIIRAIRS
jgi:SAM-dependent methyltransferase